MVLITKEQFEKGMKRLERAASAAGEADAKEMLRDDFEQALKYDPVYMRESMAFDEIVTGAAGVRMSERVERFSILESDGRIEFGPGIGWNYRNGGMGELEYRAKVAYIASWDHTIRTAARARGRVPDYLNEDL